MSLRARVAVIATGLLVTSLGWPGILGRLPFALLLKNELHLPAQSVAAFWAIATFAWYVKPVVGLLCDAYPLFGTRRRGYLLAGALGSTATWLAFALVPRQYGALLAVMIVLNVALAVVSVATGGLLVETGQRHAATGRLSSLREAIVAVSSLAAGPLGGWLATRAFGWTVGAGAALAFALVPVVLLLAREERGARVDTGALTAARAQLATILRSRAMWATSGLIFLVYLAPGFQTPLLYHQQDALKFDPRLIGLLQAVGGASSLVGALAYVALCRRLPLRVLLPAGIVLNAGSTLLFLGYASQTSAFVINAVGGALGMLGLLPLYDLAARAAPKGSESFGYALMMSVQNVAIFAVSDVLGSYLYGGLHWPLQKLVWVNALSTLAVLAFLPLLPRALTAAREGAPLQA
jgi:predicted MFS family arabinose efflux permease